MLRVASLSLALLIALPAYCQGITRIEAGVGVYGQTDTSFAGSSNASSSAYVGPFARFTFNVNRSLGLEASAFDSADAQPSDNKVGGHQVLVLGGVKAGIRRRHIGIFGRLDAGAASYSQALQFIEVENGRVLNTPLLVYRETHFALEPGGTLEAYFGPRTVLRADIDANLNAIFRTVHPIGGSLFQNLGGYVPDHLGMSLSIERRFGTIEDAPTMSPHQEHASVGGFFPLSIRQQTLNSNAPALGGGGAWIEIPNFRFLSTDVLAFDNPEDDHTAGFQDGGTSFSAFAGPKVGFHMGRFGIFAKARPGLTRFSRTDFNLTITPPFQISVALHPQYDFSLDTGGVLEYTAARHLLLRLEAGDDVIFFHAHNSSYNYTYLSPPESGVAMIPAVTRSSLLFLTGIGFRF